MVVAAELEPRDPEGGEAVEVLTVEDEVEHGHPVGREDLGPARLEPGERLAHAPHHPGGEPCDVPRQGARREDDALRHDLAAVRPDADSSLRVVPLEHALPRPHDGAARERALDVRDDAALGNDEPPVGLEHDLQLRRQRVRGKAPRHLTTIQNLVRDVVVGAGAQHAFANPLAALDDPRHMKELLVGLRLELAPELVRPAEERDVVRVLEIGEPDDPRQAV